MIRISPFGKAMLITLVSVLIAGACVFAMVLSVHAISCTNSNLGDRNGVTAQATNVQIADAEAFRTLLHNLAVPGASAEQKLRAYETYVAEQSHYVRVLVRINKYRAAHPLGNC